VYGDASVFLVESRGGNLSEGKVKSVGGSFGPHSKVLSLLNFKI
jgi:hypothetical protein